MSEPMSAPHTSAAPPAICYVCSMLLSLSLYLPLLCIDCHIGHIGSAHDAALAEMAVLRRDKRSQDHKRGTFKSEINGVARASVP
jgi:hypothetical protein